jgi:competence protein ComEA
MLKKFLAFLLMCFTAVAMAAVVDVNKASEAELDGVKGIGPVTSKLIMSERKKGEFKDWQDFIDRVKGIGDGRAAKLSEEGLRVNGRMFKGAAATKTDTQAAAKVEKKDAKAETAKAAASAKK